MILVISLLLALPAAALAEVVGHLTQVEGRVELLKGGKLPGLAGKVQDGVEPGDVLRTKSLSRAQITFMDNTRLTLSPESRIAIEEYAFDPAKGKRSAMLQLFQGLAHFMVTQVFKAQEPDFLVKTHTGVLGVRGTDFGIQLSPNDSTFLNFEGLVRVGNIFPEVGGTFKKADKIAFSFGSATVDLKDMQGTRVTRGLPPTLPFTITAEDRQMFMRQLNNGLVGRAAQAGTGPGSSAGMDSSTNLVANLPSQVSPVSTNLLDAIINNLYIPPRLGRVVQQVQSQSQLESFTFNQLFSSGAFSMVTSGTLFNQGVFSGSLAVSRTVAYPGSFIAIFSNLTATSLTSVFPSTGDSGSFNVLSNTVSVTGNPGGVLVGTMQLVAQAVGLQSTTDFTLSGPVAIGPNGGLVFKPGGTFTINGVTGIITAGTWLQVLSTGFASSQTMVGVSQVSSLTRPTPGGTRQNLLGARQVPHARL
jgi:hypothetical protein